MDAYYHRLDETLKRGGIATPVIVLDLDRLDHNIAELRATIPHIKAFRLVAKSLPSIPLLDYISSQLHELRLMCFHLPFLIAAVKRWPTANILLGKPLPVSAAVQFYRALSSVQEGAGVTWLVDTPQRLLEYLDMSKGLELSKKGLQPLNIALEIDVGLHRGGVSNLEELDLFLDILEQNPVHLQLTGLMGYDAHVGKLPGWLESANRSFARSQQQYRQFVQHITQRFPGLDENSLTLNGAGSPTLHLHNEYAITNDLAAGSVLVKPGDFDLPALKAYVPAIFVATPVLKLLPGLNLPGPGWFSRFTDRLPLSTRNTLFSYGGNWLADPCWPPGVKPNPLIGTSSNQQYWNCPDTGIQVDDFLFLRPQQSEAVMLQFGDLVVVRGGQLVDYWPVFSNRVNHQNKK
ncbi:MAG: alanine racemase [Pseudomonadales bacterium]|nr:alanine racemase [Pseudomonadales bacterium]